MKRKSNELRQRKVRQFRRVALALSLGVPSDELLKDAVEIDDYFMK